MGSSGQYKWRSVIGLVALLSRMMESPLRQTLSGQNPRNIASSLNKTRIITVENYIELGVFKCQSKLAQLLAALPDSPR